jgi:hypothetical protein
VGEESSGSPSHERKWAYSLSSPANGSSRRVAARHREAEEVIQAGSRSTTGRRGRGEETYLRWSSDADKYCTGSGRSSSGD